jgi:hypothetical protein
LIYLFVWETTYQRKTPIIRLRGEPTPGIVSENFEMEPGLKLNVKGSGDMMKEIEITQIENLSPTISNQEPVILEKKLTARQQRKVFRGRITKRKLLQAFIQPFPLLLFPSVLFATFVNGAFTTWLQMSGLLK